MSRPVGSWDNPCLKKCVVIAQCVHSRVGLKIGEIGLRQGANRNQVRPRTAEQGPRSRGCDPAAGCKAHRRNRVLTHTFAVASPIRGPCSALRCAHLVRIRNAA